MRITQADVQVLLQERSVNARAQLAEKIAQGFNGNEFTEKETALAVEIFRLLLRDVEVKVRRTLSEHLKHNLRLPHDIALKLARDVAEVASPMLESSYVLTEDDLIEIVSSTRVVAKLMAVSRRESISQGLARALLQNRNDAVLMTLFNNGGASIAESDLEEVLPHISEKESLLELLIRRGGFSVQTVDRLFEMVSDRLKRELISKYKLSKRMAEDASHQATRWAHNGVKALAEKQDNLETLVEALHTGRKLNYNVILKALCVGDLAFFETAMAKLAGIPLINARLLMLDPGPLGFMALYNLSPLPPALYDAVKALLDVTLEVTAYGKFYREDFRDRALERIMAKRYEQIEHMPYLMSLIGKDTPHAQHVH